MHYSNYLFIGTYSVVGGLLYNGIENLFLEPNIYESRKSIFNFGMLTGFTIGLYLYY